MSKQAFEKFLKQQQTNYGVDRIFRGVERPDVEVVSTGSLTIDYATGVGGIPRGTLMEIFGKEGIGKTTQSYYMMAEEQRRGRYAGFVNLEHRYDPVWAAKVAGLDSEKVALAEVDPGTESIKVLAQMVASGAFGIVVFDSIGSMLSDKEQDYNNKKQSHGQSQLVTHLVKLVAAPAYHNRCTVVLLNQVRDKTMGLFTGEAPPGGHAIGHQSSVIIHMKSGKQIEGIIEGEKQQIGRYVTSRITKSQIGSPYKSGTYTFWNYPSPEGVLGIDRNQEIVDLSFKTNIFNKEGSKYFHETFPEGKIVGKNNVAAFLKGHPDAFEQVRLEIMKMASADPRIDRETLAEEEFEGEEDGGTNETD